MVSQKSLPAEEVDGVLKALLVLARATDEILVTRAVGAATNEPLSFSKVQIMRLLAEHEGQTSGQLARFLGVSRPAVTQIVDALVQSKLVVRRSAKEDRREVTIRLTRQGKLTVLAVRRKQRHLVRNAFRLLGSQDTQRWTKSLQQMANALARADKAFESFCLQCGSHADDSCVLVGGDAACLFLKHSNSLGSRSRRKRVKK